MTARSLACVPMVAATAKYAHVHLTPHAWVIGRHGERLHAKRVVLRLGADYAQVDVAVDGKWPTEYQRTIDVLWADLPAPVQDAIRREFCR